MQHCTMLSPYVQKVLHAPHAPVVLTGYPYPPILPGGYPTPAGYPPSWSSLGSTLYGYPPGRVPPGRVPPQQVPGRVPPPRCLPHGILGNVAKHYGIWVPPPPLWTDRWKDRHVSKHYLPVVLRTRAVMRWMECPKCIKLNLQRTKFGGGSCSEWPETHFGFGNFQIWWNFWNWKNFESGHKQETILTHEH